MTYRPQEFWEDRLERQFDLRGTGEVGLSLAYNRACYALRHEVLDRTLSRLGLDPRGRAVLDVGSGTGFFVAYYLERGARVTGLDITRVSVERLSRRFPAARFIQADVSEAALSERYDIVNAFDVLYHITDDARWEAALANLAQAVAPGGALLVTDVFRPQAALAEHNVGRSLARYRAVLEPRGLRCAPPQPTHVLLNRELGAFRFLNRVPGALLAIDRALLDTALARRAAHNCLLAATRER